MNAEIVDDMPDCTCGHPASYHAMSETDDAAERGACHWCICSGYHFAPSCVEELSARVGESAARAVFP